MLVEDIFRICLAFFIVCLALFQLYYLTLALLMNRAGIMMLFFVAFAFVLAIVSGATLLATNFLWPTAITISGLSNFLLLVISASVGSTFLILCLEKFAVEALQRLRISTLWIQISVMSVEGLLVALMLVVTARFVSGVELSTTVTLAVGWVSTFTLRYIELSFDSTDLTEEELTLLDLEVDELD